MLHRDGRFLWILRGPGASAPGYWTPPSGGIEEGETPQQTVIREMAEELGIDVEPVRSLWKCPTEDGRYDLDWWLADIIAGEPRPAESEIAEVRWVTPEEIRQLTPTFADDVRFIDEVWPTLD